MNQPLEVLCVGEALVMVTPDNNGRINADSTFVLRSGGAESNVATMLAALGHETAWASRVGNDPFGDIIAHSLDEVGVDTSFIERTSEFPTGVYFKDPHESGTTVYYYRDGSAASQMNTASANAWAALTPAILHLSGITAALSAGCHDLIQHLINERPLASSLVSFDVNYRPALWPVAEAAPMLLSLAQSSDIVFVGRDEAELLWGTSTEEEIRQLLDRPRYLIVKDGAEDATCFDADGKTSVAAPTVEVVEVVGAGDAFASGWLSGFLRGLPSQQKLRLGHFVASQVLRSPSDTVPLPPYDSITQFLESDPSSWDTAGDLIWS